MARLFADDCILYKTIHSFDDCHNLQDDLQSLEQLDTKWLMKFTKCYDYIPGH